NLVNGPHRSVVFERRWPGFVGPAAFDANLPSFYGFAVVGGYDLLVEQSPPNRRADALLHDDALKALRTYGVRWLILNRVLREEAASAHPPLTLNAASMYALIRGPSRTGES